jgi:hypothetical protein
VPAYFAKPPKGASLNRGHPLAGGLVCAYLFNEGGGLKLYDSVGRTSQTATATGVPSWTNGPIGKVVRCDTAGQLFTGGSNPLSGSSVFSVSAWVNVSNISFADSIFFQSYDSGVGSGFYLKLDSASSAKFNFQKVISYSAGTAVSNAVAVANKWTHLAGTCDANGLVTLYVDGLAQTTTGTKTGSLTNTNTTTILGGTHGASRINQGSGILVWKNRCLTARNVQQLYADSFQMFRRELVPIVIHSTAGGGGSVGTAAGTSTVSGVGSSAAASVGTVAGTSTVAATGQATVESVASSAGTSTASSVGASVAASVGSVAGASTASAVGDSTTSGQGVGTAAGTSTASGVGAASSTSAGSVAGTSTASAVGAAAIAAIFSAFGTSTANGVSPSGMTPDGRSAAGADLGSRTATGDNMGSRTATGSNLGSRSVTGRGPN